MNFWRDKKKRPVMERFRVFYKKLISKFRNFRYHNYHNHVRDYDYA